MIEKYYDEKANLATVLSDGYGRTLANIQELGSAAVADFPDLKPGDITLAVFGPPRHERMIALQFVPSHEPPESYKRFPQRVLCDYYML